MFSKEQLVYASPRRNLVASKTSFLIRDILGGVPEPEGTLFGIVEETADAGVGLATPRSPWSAAGPAGGPQDTCCGGLLFGCVTVPCLGCAASWSAGGYTDLATAAAAACLPSSRSSYPWSSGWPASSVASCPRAGSPLQGSLQDSSLCPEAAAALSRAEARKSRRNRTVFTEGQLMGLERRFDSQKYLSTPDRADLARALGLTQLQVKTWYQNRRMKWKKQVMQGGCSVPPTKPKGRPKKNSIPSLAQCQAQQQQQQQQRQLQQQQQQHAGDQSPLSVGPSLTPFDPREPY